MKYFPIFADVEHADVLVAGGGEQAAQKVRLLLKTEARITIVAELVSPELDHLAKQGRVAIVRRAFAVTDVSGKRIVYAATGDRAVDAAVSHAAQLRGVPVNVVDVPELSTFITPAIVDRDPVTVAIGTEGAAPVLARQIKTLIETLLPANLGMLARRARDLRESVARSIVDPHRRRRFWERLLSGPFRRAVLCGAEDEARRILASELKGQHRSNQATPAGRVMLIGCGPGDADLLTLRAVQRLQEADVLVVDRLVDAKILEYARRDAERIFVGKAPHGPATSQAEINRLIVREARAGKAVARLKGGDPFIFGRAAEEMAACQAADIPVEVVAGVTAAHACAARVGLPLTLRERIRQFAVVTGASADGEPDLDWPALAAKDAAFAIYMGIGNVPLLRRQLLAAGADADTAVVIVENGTRDCERTIATTLADLTDAVLQYAIVSPAVMFVGLDWTEAGVRRPASVIVHRRGRRPAIELSLEKRAANAEALS